MNSIIHIDKVFDYNGQTIRVVGTRENPLFVVADICRILGLSNPTMVLQRIKPEYIVLTNVPDQLGRPQPTNTVTKPGLYAIIFQSQKESALEIQNWVFEKVLPEIDKTGSYLSDPAKLDREREQKLFEMWGTAKTGKAQVTVAAMLAHFFGHPLSDKITLSTPRIKSPTAGQSALLDMAVFWVDLFGAYQAGLLPTAWIRVNTLPNADGTYHVLHFPPDLLITALVAHNPSRYTHVDRSVFRNSIQKEPCYWGIKVNRFQGNDQTFKCWSVKADSSGPKPLFDLATALLTTKPAASAA